jgi:RNA polymerase sigma-70 factor (ECF subfamily)
MRVAPVKTPASAAPGASWPHGDFKRLYQAEFAYVWRALRRLGARGSDAEDMVHDVFLTAFKRISEYDPSRPIRPWLFGISFRTVVAHRRRAFQRYEVVSEVPDTAVVEPDAEARLQAGESRELVLKALEALPLDRRAVFVMHELDDVAIPEVAEGLGVPLNTAYSRLRVGRQEFAEAVEALRKEEGRHGQE